jgi:hypothetical protein
VAAEILSHDNGGVAPVSLRTPREARLARRRSPPAPTPTRAVGEHVRPPLPKLVPGPASRQLLDPRSRSHEQPPHSLLTGPGANAGEREEQPSLYVIGTALGDPQARCSQRDPPLPTAERRSDRRRETAAIPPDAAAAAEVPKSAGARARSRIVEHPRDLRRSTGGAPGGVELLKSLRCLRKIPSGRPQRESNPCCRLERAES